MNGLKLICIAFSLLANPFLAVASENSADFKEFWDACAYCKEEVVNKYVEEDLNVINMATVHGETCLFLTAVKNCYSIAEKLIELGSDVNARIEHPDGHRNTPLIWHTYRSNHKIVRLLIEKGADVNANVDAVGSPGLKVTALDIAQVISHKQNMDEDSMQTFITINQGGGITYKQWVGEEKVAELNQRLQSA